MAEGTITKKDIITDDAINWGAEYAKIMDMAIGKNKEFADGILAINNANNLLRSSNTQKEFIENQKKVNEEANKTLVVWKEQNQLELALISTKKKNELATESTNRKLTEERLLLAQTNKLIKQEALDRLGLTGAYDKLSRARAEAKIKLRDLIVAEGESSKAVRAATKEFEALDAKVKKADKAVGDFTKNVGNYPTLTGLKNSLKDLVGAFGVATGAAAFAAVLADAYKTIKTFEQGLADLSAITGASGKDLDFLKNSAIDLGKTVAGGAIAVVEAYKLIASAKPELLSNVKALNQVTDAAITLSQAAGMELPAAATALTDAMNQFGAGAEQAQLFIDALANGAKFGSAEIPQLTDALLKFGAVSRTANISIQESTALVELLAENGLKGADAGTALRNVLLKLSAPDALPKKAKEAIEALGISFKDLSDTSKPIQERLETLKPLLKDNAGMVKVFGLENVVAATNVLQHTDRLKELTSQMKEVGTAEEQAAIRMDTVNGKTEQLKSTYDSLVLSIGKGSGAISEFFKFWIDGAKDALESLIRMNTSWDELNKKAENEGTAKGSKTFQSQLNFSMSFGSKDELGQIEAIRKTAFNQRKVLYEEYLKNQKALKNYNTWAIHLTGPSGKDLKLEKERLIKEIAERDQILKEAETRSALLKNKKSTTKITNTPETTGLTDKEIKDALARAKKLDDSIYELQKQRLERSIKINDEIAKDEDQTDEVRIAALEVSQKKQIALANLTKKHSLDYDKFVLEADKLNANQKTFIANEAANKIVDINKKTSEDIAKINEFDLKKYQDNLEEGVKKHEIAMNEELANENKRFAESVDLESMKLKDREAAILDHEKRIFEIKKEYAIAVAKLQADNLEAEINAFKAQSDGSEKSNKIILDLEKKLSDARLKLTELGLDTFKKGEKEEVKAAKEKVEQITRVSQDMTDALGQLASAFSEQKIQQVDDEINKINEYYDKQIELAGNDARKKELLEQERKKKSDELEKKKRKEQEKQAKFEKAITITQIALKTALAIITAAAATAPTFWGVAIAAGIGAIEMGAALATPIPKYKTGRKGGPAETAWVGDGFRHEVITDADGSNPVLTPNKPTLTHLKKDDRVFESVDAYNRYIRASILNGFRAENQRISDFQANQYSDKYSKEIVDELKRNTQAIKSQKFPSNNQKTIDINHHLWKMGNTNWSK